MPRHPSLRAFSQSRCQTILLPHSMPTTWTSASPHPVLLRRLLHLPTTIPLSPHRLPLTRFVSVLSSGLNITRRIRVWQAPTAPVQVRSTAMQATRTIRAISPVPIPVRPIMSAVCRQRRLETVSTTCACQLRSSFRQVLNRHHSIRRYHLELARLSSISASQATPSMQYPMARCRFIPPPTWVPRRRSVFRRSHPPRLPLPPPQVPHRPTSRSDAPSQVATSRTSSRMDSSTT